MTLPKVHEQLVREAYDSSRPEQGSPEDDPIYTYLLAVALLCKTPEELENRLVRDSELLASIGEDASTFRDGVVGHIPIAERYAGRVIGSVVPTAQVRYLEIRGIRYSDEPGRIVEAVQSSIDAQFFSVYVRYAIDDMLLAACVGDFAELEGAVSYASEVVAMFQQSWDIVKQVD